MSKIDLTGEYHTDCNMLMARLEEAESWRASHARESIALAQAWEQRDAAKDQLGAALFLLKEAKEIARLFDDELTAQISRFIARNSQSAQQPAQGEGGAS